MNLAGTKKKCCKPHLHKITGWEACCCTQPHRSPELPWRTHHCIINLLHCLQLNPPSFFFFLSILIRRFSDWNPQWDKMSNCHVSVTWCIMLKWLCIPLSGKLWRSVSKSLHSASCGCVPVVDLWLSSKHCKLDLLFYPRQIA